MGKFFREYGVIIAVVLLVIVPVVMGTLEKEKRERAAAEKCLVLKKEASKPVYKEYNLRIKETAALPSVIKLLNELNFTVTTDGAAGDFYSKVKDNPDYIIKEK